MVFFSSCASVKYHGELLNYIDIPVKDIHGKQKQQKRTTTFFEFCQVRGGRLRAMPPREVWGHLVGEEVSSEYEAVAGPRGRPCSPPRWRGSAAGLCHRPCRVGLPGRCC
jgi:hypothetical protein